MEMEPTQPNPSTEPADGQPSVADAAQSSPASAPAPRWMLVLIGIAVLALVIVGGLVAVSVFRPAPAPRTMAELKIAEAQSGVKKRPNDFAAHLDLGGAYLEVGKDEEATREFETVIKLAPDNYLGYYALANAYVVTDRQDEAIKLFVKAIDRVPANGALYYGLGDLYTTRKEWKNAIVVLEVGVAVEPSASDTRILLAKAYEETGKRDKALAQYLEAARYGSQEASAAAVRLQATDTTKGAGQ